MKRNLDTGARLWVPQLVGEVTVQTQPYSGTLRGAVAQALALHPSELPYALIQTDDGETLSSEQIMAIAQEHAIPGI